jgi:hypothetical protein
MLHGGGGGVVDQDLYLFIKRFSAELLTMVGRDR